MEEKHACKLTFLAHTDKLSHLLLGPFSHIYGWDHNCVFQYDGDLFRDGSSLKSKMKLTRCKIYLRFICQSCIAWKVSVFRVILVRIFPHSDWIRRDTEIRSISLYSVWMRENSDQYNSEYGHFTRSADMEVVKAKIFNENVNWWSSKQKITAILTKDILYKVNPNPDPDLQKKWTTDP